MSLFAYYHYRKKLDNSSGGIRLGCNFFLQRIWNIFLKYLFSFAFNAISGLSVLKSVNFFLLTWRPLTNVGFKQLDCVTKYLGKDWGKNDLNQCWRHFHKKRIQLKLGKKFPSTNCLLRDCKNLRYDIISFHKHLYCFFVMV